MIQQCKVTLTSGDETEADVDDRNNHKENHFLL